MTKQADPALLQAALIGYEERRKQVESAIADIRKQLGGRAVKGHPATDGSKPKRVLSAAGRKRIREALKRRWAEYAKKKAQAEKAAAKPKAREAKVEKLAQTAAG